MVTIRQANQPGRIFTSVWKEIQTEVPYSPDWATGTAQLEGVVMAAIERVELPGDMGKSTLPDGRRVIIIATRFGNVAVFDRFKNQGLGGVYGAVGPKNVVISVFFSSPTVSEAEMVRITGGWDYSKNIGWKIELMAESLRPI